MAAIIEMEAVGKQYKRGTAYCDALSGVTMSVAAGTILACVGPNGAGKTTLFKLLSGLVFPTAGRISVLGGRPGTPAVQAQLGYCMEVPHLHENLTLHEYLTFCGRLSDMPLARIRQREAELLVQLDAVGLEHKVIRTMSKGQKQRVNLAQSLLCDPALLLLDEPFSGLDPTMQRIVRELMEEYRRQGKTVVINSHQLAQVEQLCDEVILLTQGRLSQRIHLAAERQSWVLAVFTPPATGAWAPEPGAVALADGRYEARVAREALGPWLAGLVAAGGTVHTVREGAVHLEDVYADALARKEGTA